MNIRKTKINMIKEYYKYSQKLLDILNKVEFTLNYLNNFDYSEYSILNIHGIIEYTFNYKFENTYKLFINNEMKNTKILKLFDITFSYLYKYLNNFIEYLENTIKLYKKFLYIVENRNILVEILIDNLMLDNNISNYSEYSNIYYY